MIIRYFHVFILSPKTTMKSARLFSLSLALIISVSSSAFRQPDNLDEAIEMTDRYMRLSDSFIAAKKQKISDIESRLESAAAADSVRILIDLGAAFRRYDVDSAEIAYRRAVSAAIRNGDAIGEARAKLGVCSVNPMRGIIRESIQLFDSIDCSALDSATLLRYFDTGFDLYLTASLLYPAGRLSEQYYKEAYRFNDSLAMNLPVESPHREYHKGLSLLANGANADALACLMQVIERSEFGDELYPRAAASVADYYLNIDKDDDSATFFLALSAMSDFAAGTREMTSLQRLGLQLYKKGDIDRAYRYVFTAFDRSLTSGSKVRTLSEANVIPIITKSYRDKDLKRFTTLVVLICVLMCLLILLAILLFVNHRRKLKLTAYKSRLAETNLMKDDYIKNVLALCSEYIERLEDLNTLILRKIKAGQAQDLYLMAQSGDFLRDNAERFIKTFDHEFLIIYPNFVSELNTLLKKDCQFENTNGDVLTTEQRIAAFMRLGIDDPQRIARFLGLSKNTVYTYRNRLKNRAINRADFAGNIDDIGDIRDETE